MNSHTPPVAAPPETDASVAERRSSVRYEVSVPVHLMGPTKMYLGSSQNMSEGGLFIATHCLLPIGMRASIEIALPGVDRPLVLDSEIRWVRFQPPGMGIQFLNTPEEDLETIRAFLRTSGAESSP